jgi:acyl-CoA thioester hydrolase
MSEQPNFSARIRVYWEDTDGGGVVYYANYLKFMERCRTDWLRALGVDQSRLRLERQLQFAVVDLQISYLRPAVLDDELLVSAMLVQMKAASFLFKQEIWRDAMQLVDASTRVVCLDSSTLKPKAIPVDLFKEWR